MELEQTQDLSKQTPQRGEKELSLGCNMFLTTFSVILRLMDCLQAFLEGECIKFLVLSVEESFWESSHLRKKETH